MQSKIITQKNKHVKITIDARLMQIMNELKNTQPYVQIMSGIC